MKRLVLIAAAVTLAACATPTPPVANARITDAGIGRTAIVNGLRIRPLAVVEDSRCPMNARCVWAGRIVVRVALSGRGRATTRNLTLGETADHSGGRLALVGAEPNRMAGAPQAPAGAYRFTFSYER